MHFLDYLLPKYCLGCKKALYLLCPTCQQKIAVTKKLQKNKLGLTSFLGCGSYQGTLRQALLQIKYKHATLLAGDLANLAKNCVQNVGSAFPAQAVLIPIPSHWYKHNLRGFNQTEIIGRIIAQELNWQYFPQILIKKRFTVSQTTLNWQQRQANLHHAFEIHPTTVLPKLPLVIFDDVLTTGSTLSQAQKILHTAFPHQLICGLTLAYKLPTKTICPSNI